MPPPVPGQAPPQFVSRAPRVEIVLKVEFESVGQLRADFLSNLSTGGMFVRTPVPFAVGQTMALLLSLPGVIDPPVRVDAEVRWLTSDQPDFLRGVGVAFKSLAPELKARLDLLLATSASPGPQPSASEKGPSTVALMVKNPILREIIKSELERLAKGAGQPKVPFDLLCPADLAQCQAALARSPISVVIADADGLGVQVSTLVEELRGWARRGDLPVVVMQGAELPVQRATDRHTVLLRKPVGMKPLFSTLVALATKGSA